ncbi:MAG: dihydrolipoyl dehydrogenase family protein [Vampirovibrionales bacterium]
MTTTSHYEIAIIGAGPGGYTLAKRLAKAGKKVALIDKQHVGGTCLQAGCIPSKAMIQASHGWDTLKHHGASWGILGTSHTSLDWQVLQKHQRQAVGTLTQGLQQSLKHLGVETLQGVASFQGSHTLNIVQEAQTLSVTFDQAVIATGGTPLTPAWLPPVDGTKLITSDHLWHLQEAPTHLLILGGGVIGLEMACMMAGLGISTTVVELQDTLCASLLDPDLSRHMTTLLRQHTWLTLHLGCQAQQVMSTPDGVRMVVQTSQHETLTLEGSHLLLALGRKPYTTGLGLETLGLTPQADGTLATNAQGQTNLPHIYALGDCTQGVPLAHRASMQAHCVAQTLLCPHRPRQLSDHQALPNVVFSSPEIASVGLTQAEATAQGYTEIRHWDASYKLSGKAWGHSKATAMAGVCRWVTHGKERTIIGAQVVGEQASELIAQAGLALEFQATLEDIALTIHAHPTLSELWWEAALTGVSC